MSHLRITARHDACNPIQSNPNNTLKQNQRVWMPTKTNNVIK